MWLGELEVLCGFPQMIKEFKVFASDKRNRNAIKNAIIDTFLAKTVS